MGEEELVNVPVEELVHNLRKQIDACVKEVERLKDPIQSQGAREMALVKTKLQEAKMWAGQVFGVRGSELPAEYRDSAE